MNGENPPEVSIPKVCPEMNHKETHTPPQQPPWDGHRSRAIDKVIKFTSCGPVIQSVPCPNFHIPSFTNASGMCSPRGRAWKATPEMCHILKNVVSWLKMTEWVRRATINKQIGSSKLDHCRRIFSSTHSGATSSWRLFRQLWDSENLFSPVSPVPSMAFTSVTASDVKHPICPQACVHPQQPAHVEHVWVPGSLKQRWHDSTTTRREEVQFWKMRPRNALPVFRCFNETNKKVIQHFKLANLLMIYLHLSSSKKHLTCLPP